MSGPRFHYGFDRSGKWRTVERGRGVFDEVTEPGLDAFVEAKFPQIAGLARGPNRRRVLQLIGASLALSGLAGCGDPRRHNNQTTLVPYVHDPLRIIPGEALSYASASLLDGIANGILVTTTNGRPIKIEGNKQHPWSRGGTDIFTQASILGLYDPERAESVRQMGRLTDWSNFQDTITGQRAALQAKGGVRLLTGPVSSPSMADAIRAMQRAYPDMRWHVHAPLGRDEIYLGAKQAFGEAYETRWNFDRADVVVSLDGDFLDAGPQQIGLAERWSAARRKAAASGKLLTLYAVAPTHSLTTANADRNVVARHGDIAQLAGQLLAEVNGKPAAPGAAAPGQDALSQWRAEVSAALRGARGRSIVLTGAHQPAAVHEAVQRLNAALGNTGGGNTAPVFHTKPVLVQEAEPLDSLVADMRAGRVATLLMLDTNPVYTAPGSAEFAKALKHVGLKIQASQYLDETAVRCDWHLPLSHPLERWGDARAFDGTVSLLQPMIEPLYASRSPEEVLSIFTDNKPRSGYKILSAYWQKNWRQTGKQGGGGGKPSPSQWRDALMAGFIRNSAYPAEDAVPTAHAFAGAAPPPAPSKSGFDVLIRPDPSIHDGQFANIGWLQELPKPLTKIVWDNIIAISPGLARREHLKDGDVVELAKGNARISGPVWAVDGQQADTLTLYLGYGRQRPGTISDGVGYDAYPLRVRDSEWQVSGVKLARTTNTQAVATTQELFAMEGHNFARKVTLGAPPLTAPVPQPTLYEPWPDDGYAWAMVIDLDSCIGCNACVVACQAENNIPIVGRDQVLRGRDMHWLRIDRYTEGTPEAPDTRFMPVPCMMCEDAPCEVACPVEATVHDHEGLNLMVYNRCIGTRACEAYCPYKVRHFNFTDYALNAAPSAQAQYNPEVSVRGRGVMEKCTYCVQRIEHAHIQAGKENRPVRDGEVVTACQGACPARAITFGNLKDKDSMVSKARAMPRNYTLLEELNTRPRTTYLAALEPGSPKPPEDKA